MICYDFSIKDRFTAIHHTSIQVLCFDWLVWNDWISPHLLADLILYHQHSNSLLCLFYSLRTPTESLHLSAFRKMKIGPKSRDNRVWNYIFCFLNIVKTTVVLQYLKNLGQGSFLWDLSKACHNLTPLVPDLLMCSSSVWELENQFELC